ncbi:MAG: Na+/H+ antiporter subunit E [Pigmentiphaga sp.]|nr:Na+/H+ antiporter subunit E [Pigmentiphaga sp.]
MSIIVAKRFVLFALVWLILSEGDASSLALILGGAATAGATWASLVLLPPDQHRVKLAAAAGLLPGFVASSFKGGIDVARRALHPRLPLDAGWIAYRTTLPRGLPRVSFGCETSLLPGSLVAGARGDVLYVHCLDKSQDLAYALSREERRIAAAFASGTQGGERRP